jgi:hypothetical protein
MLLNPPAQRNLLSNLRARRTCQLDLRKIRLDREYTSTRGGRSNVDQQELAFDELRHLCLLLVLRLDAE